ncbi:MAG: hypothetical protein K2X82_20250 [Gemmataceae bacterium]|nr:hypothetical protein [Gemmataceae bacterium]
MRGILMRLGSWLATLFGVSRAGRPPARLGVEAFEARENPAGTVSVAVSGGLLSVTGDGLANQVQVSRVGQSVTVTGFSGTSVVGRATAAGISQVSIALGGDNDTLTFTDSGTQPLTALTVDGNDGYDAITLSGVLVAGAATVRLGRGDDTLSFSGTARTISIDGGTGNNTMSVHLAAGTVTSLAVESAERAASGADRVTVRGSGAATRVDSLTVRTGSQNDDVTIATLAASRIYAHGGGGTDDHIGLYGISLYGQRRVEYEGFERVN